MQVIFIKDLKKKAKKGDIKEVADGYAENFLIKNGYAVKSNTKNLNQLKYEQQRDAKKQEQQKEDALILKKKLEKLTLEFKVKTGEGYKFFGIISVKQIKDALLKEGEKIEKSMIELDVPIASLGFHYVKINLYPKVAAKVKVHVVKWGDDNGRKDNAP